MTDAIQYMFANIATQLEDLHAIAVEGQCAGNTPDMQTVLNVQLCSGLVTLNGTVRAIAMGLQGSPS